MVEPTQDKYPFLTEPVYTPDTLAKALGLSVKTIRRVLAKGKLKVIRPGRRALIILVSDVRTWLDERAAKSKRLQHERAAAARALAADRTLKRLSRRGPRKRVLITGD